MVLATKDVIETLRHKFQFLTVIALFFPVTMEAAYAAIEKAKDAYNITLSWGAVIAVLIVSYVLLEHLKNRMPKFLARYTDIFITFSLLSYVPVLFVLAMHGEPTVSYVYAFALWVGIVGTMLLPVVIFLALSGYAIYLLYTEPVSKVG